MPIAREERAPEALEGDLAGVACPTRHLGDITPIISDG
jgi:hypothetical protein